MLGRSLLVCLLLLTPLVAFGDSVAGALTVNGTRVSLEHGYALPVPNSFDKKKTDTLLVLSDRPLAPEVLSDRSKLMFAELNGVVLQIDGQASITSGMIYSGALQKVGKSFSSVGSHVLDVHIFTPGRIAGTVSAPEDDFFDNVYAYSAEFDLAVMGGAKSAPGAKGTAKPAPKAAKGTALAAGGGEPGRAYEAYRKAIMDGDLASLRSSVSPELRKDMDAPDFEEMLDFIREMQPRQVTITGGSVEGSTATLLVAAEDEDGKAAGTITLVREGNSWLLQKEEWKITAE
jgi:hypothetical protein